MKDNDMLLSAQEMSLAQECMDEALARGVDKVRVTLSKSRMDLVGTLNGQTDKTSSCLDRSLSVCLFMDGRFGSFSTNRCESRALGAFLDKAIQTVRTLAPDRYRDLPAVERLCRGASGDELGLYDRSYADITPDGRVAAAIGASIYGRPEARGSGYELVSEEGEYSDSICDTLLLDSQGARCRHIETTFDYGVELTVRDASGRLYSRYGWDSSTRRDGLDIASVCPGTLSKAVAAIGPRRVRSRRTTMILDRECASKVVSPILRALNAYSLQQGDSFMTGTLGQQVLPEGLTILDCPHIRGESGSRMFDSEGVATAPSAIVERGVVRQYFVNTYMSGKMGVLPTIEDPSRPAVVPWVCDALSSRLGTAQREAFRSAADAVPVGGTAHAGGPVIGADRLMELCGEGILVTDFNGGNSNTTTGDFSYGVEGFAFKGGRITHPVREMVVTGNLLTLWQGLLACGDDARRCAGRLVPSLAFGDVSFSA